MLNSIITTSVNKTSAFGRFNNDKHLKKNVFMDWNDIVVKDISGPWSTEQITCWSEELTHARDTAFKIEMYFKIGQYTHECNIKKEDENKCLPDITSVYKNDWRNITNLKP